MQIEKQYFYTLDGIRGAASILIVLRHTFNFFAPITFQESYLAVDIFFILSGVVICQAYEARLQSQLTVLTFCWFRLVRIYPLYLLGSALGLISIVIGSHGEVSEIDPERLIIYATLAVLMWPNPGVGVIYMFPLNGPSWSLFFELAANIFYAAVLRSLTNRSLVGIMLMSAIGLIICMYFAHAHSLDIGWTAKGSPAGFFRVGYSFFAGVLLYRNFAMQQFAAATKKGRPMFVPWVILSAVAMLLMASPPVAIQPYFDFVAVTAVFPVIIYLALLFQPTRAGAAICKFLGTVSYAVYAIHKPLGDLIDGTLKAAGGISVGSVAPWAGLAFVVVLLPLCSALDKIYDAPLRRFMLSLWPFNVRRGPPLGASGA